MAEVFVIDGEKVFDNFDVATKFNEYFANAGRTLAANLETESEYDFSDLITIFGHV